MKTAVRIIKDDEGTTSIEYALIAALIFIALVGSITLVSDNVSANYDDAATRITNAMGES